MPARRSSGQWTAEAIGDYIGGPNTSWPTHARPLLSGLSGPRLHETHDARADDTGGLKAYRPAPRRSRASGSLEARVLSVPKAPRCARLDRLNKGEEGMTTHITHIRTSTWTGMPSPTPEIEQERRVAIPRPAGGEYLRAAARDDPHAPAGPLSPDARDPRQAPRLRRQHRGRAGRRRVPPIALAFRQTVKDY